MKKLLVFAVSGVVSFACFGAPTATRTYVDNTVKAATNAVVQYVNQKIAETGGITQEQAEAIAAGAATTAKNEAIAAAASDAATKASNAKSEAISAAADDATIKANAAKTEAIAAANDSADTKIANVSAIKADDSAVVKLTGAQTIAGKKTVSTPPAIPQTPSANTDAASKGYVDSSASSVISTIDSRGYLTSHQSLAAYSTTEQMNTAIKNATNGLAKASEVTSQISTATAPLAQDSAVVKLTGNQTVAGNKTFSGNTTLSGTVTVSKTPTETTHAANKSYVDNATNATLSSANAYTDSQVGYGHPYILTALDNNMTLEDHHTYYITLTSALSITLPAATTHTAAKCIQLYVECNLATAPTISVVKNGNTIVYQPEDYGGPRESSDYFQPKANGKTLIHLFEVKPNVYYIQQINIKDWEY